MAQLNASEIIARIDFINKKLKEHGHAGKTFKNVNEAMQSYYYITSEQLEALPPGPELSDYLYENDNAAIQKNNRISVSERRFIDYRVFD